MQPLLAACGLSYELPARAPLFRSLDVVAGAGDLIEVRGANGSGKSTLLRCLAGLAEPSAGAVSHHAAFDYLGHRSGISGPLTPLENLRWLARLRGVRVCGAALESALARVGLGAARYEPVALLSAGQRRRAALARLLLGDARVWLLDEPLAALDEAGAALVRALIDTHRTAGGAAICATHERLADSARTLVLK